MDRERCRSPDRGIGIRLADGRAGRLSEDAFTLAGREPLNKGEFVRKNAATFTAWVNKD